MQIDERYGAAIVLLVLSVLLYGSEPWALTQRLRDKLRGFHRSCVRRMCRVNMWHVQEYRITAQALEQRLGISSFETYLVRRRLRWLGHVRRMPWHRLPRKLLTSWVAEPRVPGGQQMTYGRSILEDIRLAEEAGMVFPVAEAEVASEDEEGDGLEGLTVPELRERGRVLGVVPVGTDRDKRRSEPWVEALRVARATAQHTAAVVAAATAATRAAAARAQEAAEAANEAYCARPRQRTLNVASYDGWQRGVRVDGRDAVQVAVQERVVNLESSFEEGEAREDTDDDSFVLDEDEDVDGDGYWWWQSTEAKAARWVVPQWEVLAADRGGWRAGLKGLRVNESEVDVC